MVFAEIFFMFKWWVCQTPKLGLPLFSCDFIQIRFIYFIWVVQPVAIV